LLLFLSLVCRVQLCSLALPSTRYLDELSLSSSNDVLLATVMEPQGMTAVIRKVEDVGIDIRNERLTRDISSLSVVGRSIPANSVKYTVRFDTVNGSTNVTFFSVGQRFIATIGVPAEQQYSILQVVISDTLDRGYIFYGGVVTYIVVSLLDGAIVATDSIGFSVTSYSMNGPQVVQAYNNELALIGTGGGGDCGSNYYVALRSNSAEFVETATVGVQHQVDIRQKKIFGLTWEYQEPYGSTVTVVDYSTSQKTSFFISQSDIDGALTEGAIAGIVIGVIVFVVLVIIAAAFLIRRRRYRG